MDRADVTRTIQAAYDLYGAVHHSTSPSELLRTWTKWVPAWREAILAVASVARKRTRTLSLPQKMAKARDADLVLRWLWLAAETHAKDPRRAPWRMSAEGLDFATAVLPDGTRVPPPALLGPTAIAQAGYAYLYTYAHEVFPAE